MQYLRVLQIDGDLSGKEPLVPRLEKKKKPNKTRATSGRKSCKDLIHHWIKNQQGQLALKWEVPIPPEGVHTVKAILSILNSLIDKEDPSLHDLCQWTNQFYNQNNSDIRQFIDGNIFRVLNGLHLSGLLQHDNMCKENELLINSDEEEKPEGKSNGEGTPSGKSSSRGSESGEEEGSSSGSSSNLQWS